MSGGKRGGEHLAPRMGMTNEQGKSAGGFLRDTAESTVAQSQGDFRTAAGRANSASMSMTEINRHQCGGISAPSD